MSEEIEDGSEKLLSNKLKSDPQLEQPISDYSDPDSSGKPLKEDSPSSSSSSASSATLPPGKTSDLKVILTGATGFVGEGVLWAILDNPLVSQVLIIVRRPYMYKNESADKHPSGKLREVVVPDFFNLEDVAVQEQLKGYDACFYCAGISSRGMSEADYTRITYDMVMYVANTLLKLNPEMIMCHVSGGHTDSTEKGSAMWARVKGKAENALMRLSFRAVYNFRPAVMKAAKEQKVSGANWFASNVFYPLFKCVAPNITLTLKEIGDAMVKVVVKGNAKSVLEAIDIKAAAAEN